MASSKDYLDFILEQLSELDDITYRAMMGEYIIYYRGKVVGGIYDDRFLVKPVKSAVKMMPEAGLELPYEGAKEDEHLLTTFILLGIFLILAVLYILVDVFMIPGFR